MLKEKQKKNYDLGICVGRFQTHEITEGHSDLIEYIKANNDRAIIILGVSSAKHTFNNPLTVRDRKVMITEKYPDVDVYYINDCRSDEVWSKNLDKLINEIKNPNQTVVLYGSRDSFISHYSGKFDCIELEAEKKISATEMRKKVSNSYYPDRSYRAGVISASTYSYPIVHPTVDVAIFDWTGEKILLGRKPQEEKFRLIGGFADVNSDSYEADARREVFEEVGINITDPVYVTSSLIDDWRYRSENNKIKGLLFVSKYMSGKIQAGDDIAECQWVDTKEFFKGDCLIEEHHVWLPHLQKFLDNAVGFVHGGKDEKTK